MLRGAKLQGQSIETDAVKETPLMRQYWSIKKDYPNEILLFRMGDFYEMFHDDAIRAAPILNIALTSRNKKAADETPMCGVPHHSISGPISRLLTAGFKVAICDQLEDPALAKGIVKRGVTRVLSPGMVYDPETLSELNANYIAAFDSRFLSFIDATTGEAFYFDYQDGVDLQGLLDLLRPTELILSSEDRNSLTLDINPSTHLTVFDHIESTWPERFHNIPESAEKLLAYAVRMQGVEIISTVRKFEKRSRKERLSLSSTVLNHLEVLKSYSGELKGSLFHAIQRTKTSAGARLLKNYLQFPLIHLQEIEARQKNVQFWYERPAELKDVRTRLQGMGDIERRLAKLAYSSCGPRDLIALSHSLQVGLEITSIYKNNSGEFVETGKRALALIQKAIISDPPLTLKNGGYINFGYNKELDEYIELAENSQKLILEMETREKESTGISSLKVRYNNIFGYYIEVTNTHKDKVPGHYKRKQTLANAERFVTYELEEIEQKVLTARTKRFELEEKIFSDVRKEVLSHARTLLELARQWSELDVFSSLAWLALEQNFKRPRFNNQGEIKILGSRHPVIEQEVKKVFVPNDIVMKEGNCFLITGPNMAGKSTLMRQLAVTVILAQMGSYVPASEADLPIFNQIFTRIGASDSLSEGLSTFMVEMTETANLLKSIDNKSLVILDEIGRGTSTYDGLSLAQAILEYIVSKTGATTLFATHYHELTELVGLFPSILNKHMAIEEKGSKIRFTYILTSGAASKSYGIYVAELAGLPQSVVTRAKEILKNHEGAPSAQLSLLQHSNEGESIDWKERIQALQLNSMTPIDALRTIDQWQQDLS